MTKRFLAALILALALPGAPLAQGEGETLLRQLLLDIDLDPDWSASVAAIRSEDGRTIAEGLEVRSAEDGPTISISRLTAEALRSRPGGGFAAEAMRLEGMTVTSQAGTTDIPLIEAERLAIPDLRDVRFDPDRPFILIASLYSALAEAEVERLAAHELTQTQQIEVDGDQAHSTVLYSDVVLEKWTDGVIHVWSAGPMFIETVTGDGPTRIEVAGAEARRINMATIAHVLDPARYRDGRGDRVWRSAVDLVRYGPIRIIGEDGDLATIGEFGMTGFDMRQAGRPFAEAAELMLAEPDMSEAEGTALAQEFLPGVLHAFRVGEIWMDGFSLSAPEEVDASLRRFAVTGISADGIDRIGLEGFRVTAADADVSLGAFELAGLVFPELEALFRAAELGNAEDDAQAQQRMAELAPSLAPRIARMLIDGVSVTAEGIGPITLDSYLVELDKYVGAVPASARSLLTGLTIPGSVLNADPEAAAVFEGLGISSLTIDFAVDSDYSEADGRVRSTALLAARDLMSVRMEAELVGLTQSWMTRYTALAAGVPEEAMAVLAELRLASLLIEVDDQAMVDRGFTFAAAQQGRDAAGYREEIKGALPFLLGFLSDPIFRTDTGQALQTFLEGGRSLTLSIKPPSPVLLAEIIAAAEAEPQSLPGLLGATVGTAE